MFGVWYFLFVWNLSYKKKINRIEIVLIVSIYYTTNVYPYQPTYRAHYLCALFLFVITCKNLFFLWESFWTFSFHENIFESLLIMRIFLNLFFSWKILSNFFLFMGIFLNLFFLWESFWTSSFHENLFEPPLFMKNRFKLFFFHENLFEPVLLMRIFLKLFFLWEFFWNFSFHKNLF